MKSFLVDELSRDQVEGLSRHLADRGYRGPIDDIFWIPVPEDLLTAEQRGHLDSCGPFIMTLETGKGWIKLELLVRATRVLRCTCISYANEEQRGYALEFLEALLREMNIEG